MRVRINILSLPRMMALEAYYKIEVLTRLLVTRSMWH